MASFQDGLLESSPFGIHTLVYFYFHIKSGLICMNNGILKMQWCVTFKAGAQDTFTSSALFSWTLQPSGSLPPWWEGTSSSKKRSLGQRALKILTISQSQLISMCPSHLEIRSSIPAWSFWWLELQLVSEWISLEIPSQYHLVKWLLNSYPKKLRDNIVHCHPKPLGFVVIYYTAIDNNTGCKWQDSYFN